MFTGPCRATDEDAFIEGALLLLGLLDEAEAERFNEHHGACKNCRKRLSIAAALLADLALTLPPRTPGVSVRERICATAGRLPADPQVWRNWGSGGAAAIRIVRRHQGEWETVCPGIRVRQLSADPGHGSVSMLIRMDPGAQYIPHRHGGPEHCYVLEGDLCEDDLSLRAGDYQYAGEGSIHGVQWSRRGCLLLIVCSQRDELLV